ncbi:hypothetical protein HNP48_006949 [Acidovorax soli]|uniref:Uncharacterized protein n=1 Tax=Acidovorax soli TaxID=592050 RepID=A0A7X0PLM5_9BURK|nr:hypothetical protein [Acidovorax soli]MBB6564222.1 hypothetical protein [Acidovorax soli]
MGYRDSDDSGFSRHGMGRDHDHPDLGRDEDLHTSHSVSLDSLRARRDGQTYPGPRTWEGHEPPRGSGHERYGTGYGYGTRAPDIGGHEPRALYRPEQHYRPDDRGLQQGATAPGNRPGRSYGYGHDGRPDGGYAGNGGPDGIDHNDRSPSHRGSQRRYDPDYLAWREEQMRLLDEEYDLWRAERYQKFTEEFNAWRSARSRGPRGQGAEGLQGSDTAAPGKAKDGS